MGFPFFPHVYIPGNRIVIYGCHDGIEEALRRQHAAPCFPVDFSGLPAKIEFVKLEPGKRSRHAGLAASLAHLDPTAVLARGFSIVSRRDGAIVRDSASIDVGEELSLRFSHGGAAASVRSKH